MNIYFFRLCALCIGLSFFSTANSAQLVIIIDDIGNNYKLGNAMVELEGPLTLAFLPHTPHSKSLALKAHQQHKEIILHAPMQNSKSTPLGPGALTEKLSKKEFQQTLNYAIDSIPHVQGINNHMGSALTQNKQAMQWVMETLQDEHLYFIDSLTSPKSVAYQQALNYHLPALRRHIFLDNDTNTEALTKQWNKALKIAKKTGRAILIGHPYAESHAFLKQELPKLAGQNIELIPASQLLLQQAWQGFDKNDQPAQKNTNRYLLHQKLHHNDLDEIDSNKQLISQTSLINQQK